MDGSLSLRNETLTEADRFDHLRLIRSRRVGAVTFHRLMVDHGSAGAALAALPGIAQAAGVERYEICPEGVIHAELVQARKAGARLVCHGEAEYPRALRDLGDAPPVLWVRGNVGLLARPMVAIVGARNASSLGLRMARRLAEQLAEAGYVVVSGLARGIDTAAHEASLEFGTVAVMAGGVDVTYPGENAGLAAEIEAKGCLVSEQPMGTEPQARHFPLRNRIVSGLSRAVIVVEAAARSGSLITAKTALDQGREVLAVPGHPFDARAAGCNMLIRDGAVLVRSGADIIEALGAAVQVMVAQAGPPVTRRAIDPPPTPAPRVQPPVGTWGDMTALHQMILDRLGPSPLAEDQLIRDLGLPSSRIAPEILALELEGKVLRQAGGLLSRVE
jgi:DNA processing protein